MKLIKREEYLNTLIGVKGTPDIKVITGIRRSGKSKLMESYIEYIESNDSKANIIHINYSLDQFSLLMNKDSLIEYVHNAYKKSKHNYLFIDEVQMCDGFERAITNFHAEEKYDIYITGSNAFLLNNDLATLFTGRTFNIKVYPFSFKEYCQYYKYKDIQEAFDAYVLEGGMSGSYIYKDDNQKQDYLLGVFNTLVVRDIVQKYKIRKKELFLKVCDFMMDNISNITSARSIVKAINNSELPASNATITAYLKYLTNAFAFYKVRKYDIKGKKYLTSHDKYYLCDHSFRYAFLGKKNMDYGKVYENIVAMELIRRGYDLYVGSLYGKEIDFVAMKRDEKIYIQVSDDISNKKTLDRELASLQSIKDSYPKILIARTRHPEYDIEGVIVTDLASWLKC